MSDIEARGVCALFRRLRRRVEELLSLASDVVFVSFSRRLSCCSVPSFFTVSSLVETGGDGIGTTLDCVGGIGLDSLVRVSVVETGGDGIGTTLDCVGGIGLDSLVRVSVDEGKGVTTSLNGSIKGTSNCPSTISLFSEVVFFGLPLLGFVTSVSFEGDAKSIVVS